MNSSAATNYEKKRNHSRMSVDSLKSYCLRQIVKISLLTFIMLLLIGILSLVLENPECMFLQSFCDNYFPFYIRGALEE